MPPEQETQVPQPTEQPQQYTAQPMSQQQTTQPNIPQQPTQQFQPVSTQQTNDPGHGFGIAALVTSLLGLGILGVILGIMGVLKSKKVGHTNVMAIIGIGWGAITGLIVVPIFIGLVLNNFQGAQAKARDSETIVDINAMHAQLEVYYNENNAYPTTIDSTSMPILSQEALNDSTGHTIVAKTTAKTEAEAAATSTPTLANKYQYIAYGCNATGCKGYILRGYIERPTTLHTNPYTKIGLQNF